MSELMGVSLLLFIIKIVPLLIGVSLLILVIVMMVLASIQGHHYGKKTEDLLSREVIRHMPENEFQREVAWDDGWPMTWAIIGAVIATLLWGLAWWQTGGVYQEFVFWWSLGPVPMTLTLTFLPGVLWSCNWLGQYPQRNAQSKLVNIASALMISCLGAWAWPAITLLYLPCRGVEELWYMYLYYRRNRRKTLIPRVNLSK